MLPTNDEEWGALALGRVTDALPLFGIEPETLVLDSVGHLPLSRIGSSDKWTVRFDQAVAGIPVVRGSVNVLFDTEGRLLSLDSTGQPWISSMGLEPSLSAGDAIAAARARFGELTGLSPDFIGEPQLVIAKERIAGVRIPALSWEVELGAPAEGYVFQIAAQGQARVLEERPTVHRFDVGGTAWTKATPGSKPDSASNPPVAVPAAHMRLTSAAGTVVTDENGLFNFPGVNTPLDVTFSYTGPFVDVVSWSSSVEYTLTAQLLPGVNNQVTMNAAGLNTDTTQANAFVVTNQLRDWLRSLNPADATADFVTHAVVNFTPASCNASYDGASTTFYKGSATCADSAYSTIIAHESGHWMNDRYHSGNGPDGFGEGNADVFGMYLFDSPFHAEDFHCTGPGCEGRSGLNTLQFCGDTATGCYGELHKDGEVLMGALWKVRAALNASLGDTAGDLAADLLFSSWMNAYDDGEIKTIIRTHWLTLDDDDGNILNGTPHYADIEAGFLAQGFPAFPLADVNLENVTELVDTLDEAGPYGVQARVTPALGSSISAASLHFSVNGGAPVVLPMTTIGGDLFLATLPGVASPARVEYWLTGTDDLGNSSSFPQAGPLDPLRFHVGAPVTIYSDDFESASANGWTHAAILGTDDWEKGTPIADSGMTFWGGSWLTPGAAASGTGIWATDLGTDGEAAYQQNSQRYLRSPATDATNALFSKLVFRRWLSTERSKWDTAQLLAAGATIWTNPAYFEVLDEAWQTLEYDVSALVDGNPAAQFEWRFLSNSNTNLGGWALDDVELRSVGPVPTVCQPTPYGVGLGGALGVPILDSAGQPAQVGNGDFELVVKGAQPGAPTFVALGLQQLSLPLFGGTLLLLPFKTQTTQTDAFGQAHAAFPIPALPALAGVPLFFQAAVLDPTAPQGFSLTAGLQSVLCP